MKHKLVIFLTVFSFVLCMAQKAENLFRDKNYPELVKLEKDSNNLSPRELYMLGYAFFQLENDSRAVAFYDKAIGKGLDSAYVHCDKGIALRYSKYYGEAIKEFDIAIKKAPHNQMYRSEKGFAHYYAGDLPKAFDVFLEAQKLPNSVQAPFYMVPRIYQENGELDKALAGFNKALKHISKDNEYYVSTLADIGWLEYAYTKNYARSAEAYAVALRLNKRKYDLYSGLMKAWNAGKFYARADSVFDLMKRAYDRMDFSDEEMKYKNVVIDEDEWRGQKLSVYRSLAESKESSDAYYKVYLLNKEGDKAERTFMVEKAASGSGTPVYQLCEKSKKAEVHLIYPQSWDSESVPLEDLKKSVMLVLDGKLKAGASSNGK
jgi:tetratricopeptide (TPR) repeat protein